MIEIDIWRASERGRQERVRPAEVPNKLEPKVRALEETGARLVLKPSALDSVAVLVWHPEQGVFRPRSYVFGADRRKREEVEEAIRNTLAELSTNGLRKWVKDR